jgi:putative ABC transport system permease protein
MLSLSHLSHLFKLVWNRKRSNSLMIIELFAAFLVLFFVVLAAIHFATVYRQSLGYEYKDVWNILAYQKQNAATLANANKIGNATTNGARSEPVDNSKAAKFQSAQTLLATLRGLPQVESAAFMNNTPFSFSQSNTEFNRGRKYRMEQINVTDDAFKTLNLTLLQGRWFNASDEIYSGTTSTVKPIVISQFAAATFFGQENPIGKDITYAPGESVSNDLARMRFRVIGVIMDFRRGSEFDQSSNLMFRRVSLFDTTSWLPSQIVAKMKSGVSAAYEEQLLKTLEQTAPNWVFQISTLEIDRAKKHKFFYLPFGVSMTVAAFLLIMVGLGLVGVVWQSVTRRMREIGVRCSFGATKQAVYAFIVGEIAVLTTFSMIIGLFAIAQMPLLPFFDVPQATYLVSIGVAIVGMYVLTTLCAIYPSLLATKVQPAEALRYE